MKSENIVALLLILVIISVSALAFLNAKELNERDEYCKNIGFEGSIDTYCYNIENGLMDIYYKELPNKNYIYKKNKEFLKNGK